MQEIDGKIEYTPEELQEINRILNYISQETLGQLPDSKISADAVMEVGDTPHVAPGKEFDIQEEEKYPEEMEMLGKDITEEEYQAEEETAEEAAETPEEIEDITDLIQEIETKEGGVEIIPDDLLEEIPVSEISTKEKIPEEDLEASEEEAVQSIEFEGKDKAPEIPEEEEINLDFIAEEEPVPAKVTKKTAPAKPETAEIEEERLVDEDLLKEIESPSFTGLDIKQSQKTIEKKAEKKEIFDLDISDISPEEEIETKPAKPAVKAPVEDIGIQPEDKFPDIDFSSLEETSAKPEEKAAAARPVSDKLLESDLSADLDKIQDLFEEEEKPVEPAQDTGIKPDLTSPVKEDAGTYQPTEESEEEIELTDDELKRLNKVIQFFNPNLTKAIKDVILNDLLPGKETRELVDMLLAGTPEDDVKSYIEKKLKKKIEISRPAKGRRVISARPEYTKEGRERQKRLYKISGLFAAAGVILIITGILLYKNVFIPVMAKKYIDDGVALIKKPGVPVLQKQKDYKKAEEIFNDVNDNYIKDYLYGYHAYARAYFQNKEYDYALEKLNKAYDLDPLNIDTLNNLGFYYSKVPAVNFERIKSQIDNYYYKKLKPLGPVEKQIDIAIDFYKKAISVDPKNITALYGIGNAYTNQGEFAKARQYYENILSVDKESIVGHSGLLNLYIERDALPEIISIHSELQNSKRLSEVSSPLLAKLASYYLSKKKTDEKNIRIDYGIQSPLIKDFNDNPYPAVRNVLNALSARDMDYPPLFVQFARLSKAEDNLNLMKRNLQTAIEKDSSYFASHVLLAEYYYITNDPVEAYKSCKNALQAFLSPPEFTNEDFYYETEKIGTAYAIMGNIFYYADKSKFRFGDEFADENIRERSDELANFSIAQDKYEKALGENYKSAEVFYNLGRIYYLKSQFDKAVMAWLSLYEEFTAEPELMFALGNAFYHQNNLEAGKGEFLKVISIFESKADRITQIVPDRKEHIRIFQTLASAYNNLGAVYQVQNNESKSNISYWKAIDYAKKLNNENEFARVNMARAFKPGRENALPILDENIAVSVENYNEFK